jgi:AcrR family transcriptional regulator
MFMKEKHTMHRTAARILKIAREQFLAQSYADVTMDQIAGAAKVTKGGLYHHFAGKEALYLVMMQADLSEKNQLFNKAVVMEGSCRQRLETLARSFLALPAQQRRLAGLIRRDINTLSEGARQQLMRCYQSALPDQVRSIIEHGIRAREIRPIDARLASFCFISLVEHCISHHGERVLPTKAQKIAFVLDLFFTGATDNTQITVDQETS